MRNLKISKMKTKTKESKKVEKKEMKKGKKC